MIFPFHVERLTKQVKGMIFWAVMESKSYTPKEQHEAGEMLFAAAPHLNPLPKGERKQSVNPLFIMEREQAVKNWEFLCLILLRGWLRKWWKYRGIGFDIKFFLDFTQ